MADIQIIALGLLKMLKIAGASVMVGVPCVWLTLQVERRIKYALKDFL